MYVTELDSFFKKFHHLWKAGFTVHLDLDAHAGKAWVGICAQLGHAPGPVHRQVHHPFSSQFSHRGPVLLINEYRKDDEKQPRLLQ